MDANTARSSWTPEQAQQYLDQSNTGQVPWDDNLRSAANDILKGSGGMSGSLSSMSGSGGSGDILGIAQQLANFGQQNIAPVVSSLQERYKVLLDEIGQTASRELGQRGIPISSTSAQEFIKSKQLPVVAEQNAQLAGIQAEPGQNALAQALQLIQLQNQQNQYGQDSALQKLIADRNYELGLMQENRLASSGSGISLGGLSSMQNTTSKPPSTIPTNTVSPTSGFKPIGTAQTSANNSISTSPFSSQNIKYASQLGSNVGKSVLNTATNIAKSSTPYQAASNLYNTAQNVVKSQPVQKAVSTVKNLASSATNLFKSIFG